MHKEAGLDARMQHDEDPRPPFLNAFLNRSSSWRCVYVNNTPGTHDVGGPLISADGLTLIYGASNKIYSATRINTTSPFGPGVLLLNQGTRPLVGIASGQRVGFRYASERHGHQFRLSR